MRIGDLTTKNLPGQIEVSARIGRFHAWVRLPDDVVPAARGDAFAAWALFPAMCANEPIEVDDDLPVSPILVDNLYRLQEIFRTWVPALKEVPIRCALSIPPPRQGTATFYSGGVDGGYTLVKHFDEITHLISIRGFDLSFGNDAVFTRLKDNTEALARRTGKRSLFIETNLREVINAYPMRFSIFFGAMLGGMGLLTGFERTYISSEATWNELIPWGSHPATDHLWSTEVSRTIHDGAEARRSEKVFAIAANQDIMNSLRVCPEDSDYNCGTCYKCLRTMAALRLHGLSSPMLPAFKDADAKTIAQLTIEDSVQLTYWDDLLRLAMEKGDNLLVKSIRPPIRRYLIRAFLKQMDERLWGNRLRSLERRFKSAPSHARAGLPDFPNGT